MKKRATHLISSPETKLNICTLTPRFAVLAKRIMFFSRVSIYF